MRSIDKDQIDKCPKQYLKWAFVVAGMVFASFGYLVYSNVTDGVVSSNAAMVGELFPTIQQRSVVQTAGAEDVSLSPSAFLGVEIISVNPVIAEQLDIPSQNGVLVNSVIPNSPAQKAGLQRGDCLIALNNRTVKDIDRFKEIMAKLNPADSVRVIYIRNGRKDLTYAELAESPAIQKTAQGPGQSDSGWGVSLSPISSILRESLGIGPDINGIVILSVVPGGAADRAGLMTGDVITGIDKTPISDMDDFFGALSSDKDNIALLDIYSRGGMRYVPIDSSTVKVAEQAQTQDTTGLRARIFSIFTGGAPFGTDEDEDDEGPKGGKFAQEAIELTTGDNPAFNRPSTVPGDENTGGTSGWTPGTPGGVSSTTGMNRPSEVPPQLSSTNDTVLFIGLLLIALVYLAYREFHRPLEVDKNR